jgi:hypothetical protein
MSTLLFHRCSSDARPKNVCRDLLFSSVFFLPGDFLALTGDADAVFTAAFLGVAGAASVLSLDLDFDLVDFVVFGGTATSLVLAGVELEIRRGGGPCELVSGSSSSEKTTFDVRCLFAGGEAMHNGEQTQPEKLWLSIGNLQPSENYTSRDCDCRGTTSGNRNREGIVRCDEPKIRQEP